MLTCQRCGQQLEQSIRKRRFCLGCQHIHDAEKAALYNARWRENHPERVRFLNRRAQGMNEPTGEDRIGHCEICSELQPLRQDHDHETRGVRGWLCNGCNSNLERVLLANPEHKLYPSAVAYILRYDGAGADYTPDLVAW